MRVILPALAAAMMLFGIPKSQALGVGVGVGGGHSAAGVSVGASAGSAGVSAGVGASAGSTGVSAGVGASAGSTGAAAASGAVGSGRNVTNATATDAATLGASADSPHIATTGVASSTNRPGARLARSRLQCTIVRAHPAAYDQDIVSICAALAKRDVRFAHKAPSVAQRRRADILP
jgi:hypothetical protein